MDSWMLSAGVALGVLALTLVGVLRHLAALAAQLSLLDRDQLIPKIRRGLKLSVAIAFALAAVALAASWWRPQGRDDRPDETGVLRAELEAARAQIRELQSPEPKPEPPAAVVEAPKASAPEPAAVPAPTAAPVVPPPQTITPAAPPAPAVKTQSSDWVRGRIVASGGVTLREWPNGRALFKVPPGSSVLVGPERKLAGDYDWRKIKLADGTYGWIVERFVVLE